MTYRDFVFWLKGVLYTGYMKDFLDECDVIADKIRKVLESVIEDNKIYEIQMDFEMNKESELGSLFLEG